MPIYEYRCDSCNVVFSRLLGVDANFPECPYCGIVASKIPSICNNASFKPTIDGASSRQALLDNIKKYNDGEQASKTGKVRIYD